MNFDENIKLESYNETAASRFESIDKRLYAIEKSFDHRMDGNSIGGLVFTTLFTLAWGAAAICGAKYLADMAVDARLITVALIAVLGLILFMTIDNIITFFYYGKIANYSGQISLLRNRVNNGKSQIKVNYDNFRASRTKEWDYKLSLANSVSEEARVVENTLSNTETLQSGFLNVMKNLLFFACAVIITIAGCIVLFDSTSDLIETISSSNFKEDTLLILNVIAMIIVLVAEILFARWIWCLTDNSVKNVTLFSLLAGPLAFFGLVAIVTFLVVLVIAVVKVVLYIAAAVVAIGIAASCLSGG